MSAFRKFLERIGKISTRQGMNCVAPDGSDLEELQELARWTKYGRPLGILTRLSIRERPEIVRASKKMNVLTTDDLDENGKAYSDYLERRKKRQIEAKETSYGIIDWDVRPD